MYINQEQYLLLSEQLQQKGVVLVAVSKIHPAEAILELYKLGHRDFGENYVQELVAKQEILPKDIRWHFIGHLQSNKVKYIAPFVHLVHGVDSYKLLKEISKQGVKNGRIIEVLLQVHIATEETKFGLDKAELDEIMKSEKNSPMPGIRIRGLMGMASFSDDLTLVRSEFKFLKGLFDKYFKNDDILSMGMSSDYGLALEEGSTMVRIGSLIFGGRR
jgi:pyridoxal phosphate enzyme (YggS family)